MEIQKSVTRANQAAFEVGQLAERMADGYYAHCAAMEVARNPEARRLVPRTLPGQLVPIGHVTHKDGSQTVFHFQLYLDRARDNAEFTKVWLVGSLLAVGDALSKLLYFDHAPELEMIYHLRNGVAHGNVFNLTRDGLARLKKYPTHNKLAWIKGAWEYEVVAALHGQPVLFDFMEAGDVLDLLRSVGVYLVRMGNGDQLRP